MLPLIFYSRRLNPNKIIIPLIIQSFSTKPTSHLLSQSPKPHQNPQDFDPGTIFETLSCYSNDWKSALDFFNWVEKECNFNHTTDTFNRMIDILEKFNLKDETSFCNLIDALCEHKHVIESQELCFGNNNGIDIVNKTKIYNMILRGWFKMGWWSKCREFWEEMDQKGVHKDLHSYSIYMDIVCKGGKPWKAVKLYKEMKRKGMKLDVVSYNIVVRAVGLSEGVDFAMRVYREMKELGCMPNVVTYNTIIKLLCETGRVKEAYKMLDDMRKKGIVADVITYHCFFRCLEKPKEILWLFDRMIESGVQPRMDTYVMLMRKFGRWGFLRPVLLVWKKMEEQGCSPDEFAYNALIDALVQKGMLHMARRYEEEMLAKGLSAKPRAELSKKVDEGE
ncbi:pentatricopeptide repeat-containing protein, putative [Ricinus communis]|uniref:Pentatricopeptide repeat-containing protein, putative n=1 Tax=Ricinus communis TaxID=3988 RepID=B9SWT4_RICCO|nr:pentatricopeptide repeat-containing protein, putative [Ricinus communis]